MLRNAIAAIVIAVLLACAAALALAQIGRSPMILSGPVGPGTSGNVPTDISPLSTSLQDNVGSGVTIANLTVAMSGAVPFTGTIQVIGDAAGIACGTPPCTLVGTTLSTVRPLAGSDDGPHTITLAATQNTTINRNFTLTVTATVVGGIPAPANLAGFTAPVVFNDFENDSLYDVQSNWLDCNSTSAKQWNIGLGDFPPLPPCDVHRVVDPTYGNMAMRFRWDPSYWAQTADWAHGMYISTHAQNQTDITKVPAAAYWEFTVRHNVIMNNGYYAMWGGNTVGFPFTVEYDVVELMPTVSAASGQWQGPYTWYTSPDGTLGFNDPWVGGPYRIYDPLEYHTYGMLITNNGSDIQMCTYFGRTADGPPPFVGQCKITRRVGANDEDLTVRNGITVGGGTCCNQNPAVDNTPGVLDTYIKSIKVYSCPNWQTQLCDYGLYGP